MAHHATHTCCRVAQDCGEHESGSKTSGGRGRDLQSWSAAIGRTRANGRLALAISLQWIRKIWRSRGYERPVIRTCPVEGAGPSAWLRHPCRVGHPAARRPHRSEERCCHILLGLRQLSEPARVRISEQILRSRPSHLPRAQQASKPCLSRSFGGSRPMKTSRVWRAS
jgi:hypothetical protein